MAEQIIVEYIVDYDQLDKAIDTLEKTGAIDSKLAQSFKQTTAEINKQSQAIKSEASEAKTVKKNLDDISKSAKNVNQTMVQAFQQGVLEGFNDALQEAGVTAEQLEQRIIEVANGEDQMGEKSISLKTKLRQLTEELAEMQVRGQANTEEYKQLAFEAGVLRDAMDDANNRIKNFASDTRGFDNLLGTAQAVAGGFAVVQGTAALFGEENEELQKTLLKVNAAMAITQGLSQLQLAFQKEGAATLLIQTLATKAQTAAQVIYNVVVGTSIGLMKAFRIALAATGVGLLIVGIIALVEALKSEEDSLQKVNDELERNKKLIDEDIKSIERRTEISIAQAELAGKAESDLIRIRGKSLQEQRKIISEVNKDLELQRSVLERSSEAYDKLNIAIEENNNRINEIDQKIILENISLQKQLADEAKEAAEAARKAAEDAAKKRRELRDRELQDALAALEIQLLQAEAGSQQELDIKKKIVQAKANLELNQENLTKNQVLLIRETSLKEQTDLSKTYLQNLTKTELEAQISRNNAVLANIQSNNDDRLILTIANLEAQAAIEADAANGNAAKIKEINAKRDAAILAAKKAFIEEAVEYEIALETAKNGRLIRSLQKTAGDTEKSAAVRIAALNQIQDTEISNIDKRESALEQELKQRLISEQEYQKRYAELEDKRSQIYEQTEEKITAINKSETEKRKQQERETIELALNTTQQVVGILTQLGDTRKQQDDERISAERARVDELLESGAITEKEAIARNKRIDQEEKKLKREQAQRDKNLAIFNAIVNTAAAITKALPNLVLAGIAGALGLAQVAVIAARPIPRFRSGKKNQYQGPGKIGEAGAELLESDGRLYIAKKETTVWLGKNDKVYTPEETKKLLPSVDRKLMQPAAEKKQNAKEVATELAKEIRKIPQTGITVDENGFKTWVQQGNSRTIYHDKYYSSK